MHMQLEYRFKLLIEISGTAKILLNRKNLTNSLHLFVFGLANRSCSFRPPWVSSDLSVQ